MARRPLSDFRREPATQIVSLGCRCATTFNLRRYYSFSSAYPFDWWITPERGVLGLLDRPDVDWLYDPRELELAADHRSVQHRALGVMLHHEFPRHGASRPRESAPPFCWIGSSVSTSTKTVSCLSART